MTTTVPALVSPSSPMSQGLCAKVWGTKSSSELLPTLSPTELAELRARAADLVTDAKRTVTPPEVRKILTPLVLVFNVGAAAETATFWASYAQVLAPLHPRSLKGGCEAYMAQADAKFFPKPGELLDLSRRAAEGMFLAACHAKAALSYEPPKERREVDPAVGARVQADLAAKLKRSPPPKQFTPPPTPTDERGLSPAMLAMMNRQEAA